MKRISILIALQAATLFLHRAIRLRRPGAGRWPRIRTFRSAIAIASMPPSSSRTPSPSPIPRTTSFSASSVWAIRSRAIFSPLYRGQVLVHGMGFSPDHQTVAVVSIGSNSVTFIDTATNAVKHMTYVGRSPHEAFFTPDGKEVWVTVRGENYVSVLDGTDLSRKRRGSSFPNGPGMQIFSPDGKYGYVCSSFIPETDVVSVADHRSSARCSRRARSVPTSPRRPTVRRSGLR